MPEETQLQQRPETVRQYLELPGYKARFGEVLGQRAPQFMASLVTLSNDPNLARCEPRSVIASAMIAAVLDFPIEKSLGFAHIVPYGGVAQFQMAAKGYVQLALRSGQYQRLNAKPVNAEAFVGYDDVGEPTIDWSAIDDTKPAVGYVVAWKLSNGFTKVAYWTRAKVEHHASQFSQAYKKKKMDSPWFTNFDKMAIKTVVMNELRSWGVLSVQMQKAIIHDQAVHTDIDAEPQYIDNDAPVDGVATEEKPVEQRPAPPKREKKGAAAVVENAKREAQTIDVETTVGGAGNAQAAAHTEKMKGEAAKIVSEATAANVADIKAAMAAAPVAAPAEGQAAQPAPTPVTKERAALKEGETIEAVCTVTDIDCGMMTKHLPTGEKIPTPTVSLRLTGGYYGTAYHFGGATGTDKNNLTPNPLYVPGVKLRFTLLGKMNKIPNSKVPFYTEVLKVAEIEEMGEVG